MRSIGLASRAGIEGRVATDDPDGWAAMPARCLSYRRAMRQPGVSGSTDGKTRRC